MVRNNFPRIQLNPEAQLWLEAVYTRLQDSKRIEPLEILIELLRKVPEDFDYKDIDPRLIKRGVEMTLLGVMHVDPTTNFIGSTDKVIQFIRELIIADPKIEVVTSQQVSEGVYISNNEAALILSFITDFGNFWSGATSHNEIQGCTSINIGRESVKIEYLKYKGINQLLDNYYHQYEPKRGVDGNSVVMQFDFPEEVRTPCEQYLIYFVQFLKDLGVEATADIQHKAGKVLFAVTPTDKNQALDKIRAALETYLRLASSPVGSSSDPEDEMAVQRLLANLDHLKSQLRLSYMMVRTQEITIQAQQYTIASQHRTMSGQILLDSLKDVTPKSKEDDTEEILRGMLEITKYKGKGFSVNFPEIFRQLRERFKKEG